MGWSEMEGRCKRHPNHRQSKGVCPSCLRERLSHLSTSSSNTTNASSTPYLSGTVSSSSSVSSPHHQDHKARISFLIKGDNIGGSELLGKPEPLTKSRSLAFVITNPDGAAGKDEEEEEGKGGKKKEKKRGFWSKLLVGGRSNGSKRRKEKDVLLHSNTMKETSSAKWFLLS